MNTDASAPDISILISIASALDAAADALRTAVAAAESAPPSPVPSDNAKLLITVTEAADRLSIGRSLAYQLVQTGVLPTVKLGRRRLIPAHVLVELVRRGEL